MTSYSRCTVRLTDDVHRLKDVPDPEGVAPDGQTIEMRMQKLCIDAAEDIRQCANTCDAYLKLALFTLPSHPIPNYEQEEDARQNILRVHVGRQTFEVR